MTPKQALCLGVTASLLFTVTAPKIMAAQAAVTISLQPRQNDLLKQGDIQKRAQSIPTTSAQSLSLWSTLSKTATELPEDQLIASPSGTTISAEMTEITEPDGTTVILPPGYEASRKYPALVLMPYTDRTALHFFNWGIYDAYHQRTENTFIVIMPPGQGSSANWSGWGWESFVGEYESYVQQSLNPLIDKYNINNQQLAIGGFSLGGDLSWTLSLRNPDIFSGAIVMGSMATYRNAQSANHLAANNFHYFMVMGRYDGNRDSMRSALDTLDEHAIPFHYEEVKSAGHGDLPEQMQSDLVFSAMDYIVTE